MAIPNNYIDKITNKDTGDSRIISPAADNVRVENENFEGADLDEVLDEVAQAIEDAGSGDGTVTGVKMNNGQPITPDENGVVDLGTVITDVSNKVDKVTGYGLSKNDYSDADKTKLVNIEDGAEVNVINGIKANGASETLPVENGIVTLPPAGSTISPATSAPLEDGTAGVGVSEKYAREDHVHPHDTSKQDTLSFDDVPTAGSNNPVKSGGIKTALDNLLTNLRIVNNEWYIGNTPTGVSAQGPTGNVEFEDLEDLVALLVNDLTTGGAGNFLSAEMGKVLKAAISTLIDSMGNYCFPNGRPTLSWEGAKADIVTNFNHVTSSNTAMRVDIGGRFETTLGTDDDLYILDEDSVVVEMDGVDITTTAFTKATGRISIDGVTGTIEITASGMTYVQSGLVCMFDGKHVDAANNRWVDLKSSSRVLTLSGCTVQNDHVEFDGVDDYALAAEGVGVNVDQSEGTIEGVFQISALDNAAMYPFANMYVANRRLMSISLRHSTTYGTNAAFSQWLSQSDSGVYNGWHIENDYTTAHLSMSSERAYLNGVSLAHPNPVAAPGLLTGSYSRMGIFSSIGSDNLPHSRQGKMYCVRIYSKKLSDLEIAQNYKIDRKRFNLL